MFQFCLFLQRLITISTEVWVQFLCTQKDLGLPEASGVAAKSNTIEVNEEHLFRSTKTTKKMKCHHVAPMAPSNCLHTATFNWLKRHHKCLVYWSHVDEADWTCQINQSKVKSIQELWCTTCKWNMPAGAYTHSLYQSVWHIIWWSLWLAFIAMANENIVTIIKWQKILSEKAQLWIENVALGNS